MSRSRFRWRSSWKPFGMLISTASPIGHPLAAQKREVSLHARLHCTARELTIGLVILLAVEDVGSERGTIKLRRYWGQPFIGNCGQNHAAVRAVKSFTQSHVIHVIVLHASSQQLTYYFGKRHRAAQRAI